MPPFHPHPVVLVALVVAGVAARAAGCTSAVCAYAPWRAGSSWRSSVLWPVGDLAASVSLSVATVQRLVIMLLVAPLFVASISTAHLVALTRPTSIDVVTRRLAHPGARAWSW